MLRGLSIRSIAVIFAPVTVNPTRVTGCVEVSVAGRGGRASDDGRDLIERDGEDVVQDECEPFGGRQRVQDYQ
jgi:hypothetical protein